MLRKIRVLVVDDSALTRQLVTRALEQDPRIEIVGIARDGVQAIEKARQLQPDVITLDIEMPELNGLEALPYLLAATDARVVILSSQDNPEMTYQSLAAGAVDFVTKPSGGIASSLAELSDVLIKKIRMANRIAPEKRFSSTPKAPEPQGRESEPPRRRVSGPPRMVLLAASTGGPPALEKVFSGLTRELPAAYIVVQHLPSGFTESLTRRIGRVTDLDVVVATDGQTIESGFVYLAPYGVHMVLEPSMYGRAPRLRLDDGPLLHGVKPAADPLFLSAASHYAERTIGVVLTGMGSDGAQGLRELQLHGAETIAQDEESSIVWGMPGAAVRAGAARHVVPIGMVAAEIRRALR